MVFDFSSLAPLVQQILSAPGTDLGTISAKRVRRELLALDPSLTPEFLKEHKAQVDEVITEVFGQINGRNKNHDGAAADSNRSQSLDDAEEEMEGQDEEAVDEEEEVPNSPKKRKSKKKKNNEISDAELARKLSSEINGRSSRRSGAGKASGRGSAANGTPKRSKTKTRKSATMIDSDDEESGEEGGRKTRKKKTLPAKGGFAKEYLLSQPLATLLQTEKLSRPQVVKQLWEYIKSNERQNPQDKREIICDDNLRAIFNADKIDMFKMNKVLGQHLHEKEE
ncbi:hypothetical protein PQX77_006404 [Marasmius sp. AFHP31]|nr:hypothetical protein PQX77_006404 [Marasmius sp. AFHP31]